VGVAFEAHGQGIIRTSEVTSEVTQNPNGKYTYNDTVTNTSPGPQFVRELPVWPLIIDFEVPLESPSIVWDIASPETWDYEFISYGDYRSRFGEPNPFGAPWVLHWYDTQPQANKPICPDGYAAWIYEFFGFWPESAAGTPGPVR